MGEVYTGRVRVRHHELDALGRVGPATHLRWLAQAAIDASAAAGFDAAWYAEVGAQWLVRRTTFTVHRHVGAAARLDIRTWVEDFRRVRSLRRYETRAGDGEPVLDAATDWVFVDVVTGKPRRVPDVIEQRLGSAGNGTARRPWAAPAAPERPARASYDVRWADLDRLGHVNNAAWVDLCQEALFDALAAHDWPLSRLAAEGGVPAVMGGDVEYLDEAVHGDRLDVVTWCTPAADALAVHQHVVRAREATLALRATTTWRWPDVGGAPAALAAAIAALGAA